MFERSNVNDHNQTGIGTTEKWGGNRCRPNLLEKFFAIGAAPHVPAYEMPGEAGDDRALFDGTKLDGGSVTNRNLDNTDVSVFTDGYACCKFVNHKTDGSAGHSSQFPDTDFFIMRAAEAYLTYAEADA